MICPHCGVGVKLDFLEDYLVFDNTKGDEFQIWAAQCPVCEEIVVKYVVEDENEHYEERVIYPLNNSKIIGKEVPTTYQKDFLEACNVLTISPKASAALSRRILQQILRDEYKIERKSLAEEIDEFLKNPNIPGYVKDAVDAVRNYGNFAAHPLKDTHTGEIVEVEAGEAEWLIEVIEALFDITFVQPKRLAEKQKQLNDKLNKIGKPPMKKPKS